MLPNNNKKLQKIFFWISAFFDRFLTKKQPKLTKNEENWQNLNRLMKFSEIWYVDASHQMKITSKPDFFFGPFGLFWSENEENCQNLNRLMKFSEIWYVDAF